MPQLSGRRLRLSPRAYRWITFAAVVVLAVIIVTGGAVRLSDSGLGCSDWPTCEPGSLAPRPEAPDNAWIEFLNRMFTGAVSVAVILAVLGSLIRDPRRRDLVWLSLGLVVGVIAQAVLGGLTVHYDLRPPFVMAHFLLSLVLLTNALVLHRRAGQPAGPAHPVVAPVVVHLAQLLVVAATVVVTTGTVVTGAGPHSGGGAEDRVERLDLSIPDAARVHGTSVMVFLVLVLITLWVVYRRGAPPGVFQRLTVLLVVLVAQAGVGYVQYFNDIPAILVGIHIAGATAVWAAVICVYLGLFERGEIPVAVAEAGARPILTRAVPTLR